MLRFEVTCASSVGTAGLRRGVLTAERAGQPALQVETPTFMKYTRNALQPHLVPEVAAELAELPALTRVQLEDFLDGGDPAQRRFDQTLREFAALDPREVTILDILDPTVTRRPAKSGTKYMAIDSEGGTRRLTPETFARIVDALKPDIIVPPADYVEEPLPSLTQGKRVSKSISRSSAWLAECLQRVTHNAAVFAPVMGSLNIQLRETYARDLAERQNIFGFSLNDAGLALPLDEKLALAQHSLALLDDSKPRYMAGVSAPDAVLRAVLGGVDLVDSSYPYAVTEQGFASTYTLSGDGNAAHLDVWQEAMFSDFQPLVQGCSCFTCRNHHRSYIHHLLKAREMLATVLLQVHNLHWYQRFFADMRSSLARGTLPDDAEQFLARYKGAFGELDLLATQICSPTTKIQRKRHVDVAETL